jgi:hypothetical protein
LTVGIKIKNAQERMSKIRANKKTKEERIAKVAELLSFGYPTYQIVDICKKEWNVQRRCVEKYLELVYAFMTKSLKEKDKDKILLEYEQLALKYEKLGNAKMALEYRRQRDKIIGISIERRDITTNGESIFIEQPLFLPICKKCGEGNCICANFSI